MCSFYTAGRQISPMLGLFADERLARFLGRSFIRSPDPKRELGPDQHAAKIVAGIDAVSDVKFQRNRAEIVADQCADRDIGRVAASRLCSTA